MEILYFEPTDEVTKAIERIREAAETEVALVLPQNSLILQSIVNLKLIKRISEQAGKDISLVTVDKIGRNLAGQVGLTVYGKLEDGQPVGKMLTKTPEPVTPGALRDKILQETEEITTVTGIEVNRYDQTDPLVQLGAADRPDESEPPAAANELPDLAERGQDRSTRPSVVPPPARLASPTDRRKKRRLWLWGGAAVIIGGWWFFTSYLVATRILVTVKGEPLTFDTTVTAAVNPNADQVKLLVYSSEQTGSKNQATSGVKNLGNKAKGTVSLVNSYSSSTQTIPAGSTLTINGLSYTLTQAATVPGAEFAVEGTSITVKKPGRIEGSIEAASPGDNFNINGGRMTITGVTAERDNKVYAENPVATGGTTVNKKIVAEADLTALRDALTAELTAKAVEAVNGQAAADFLPIGELGRTDVTSYQASAAAGAEAESISASAGVSVRLAGVAKADLVAFAVAQATKDRSNQSFAAASDPVLTVLTADTAAPSAQLRLVVPGTISARVDTDALKRDVIGLKEADARAIISQIPLYSKVEFRYAPAWLDGRVARRSNRVSVEVVQE